MAKAKPKKEDETPAKAKPKAEAKPMVEAKLKAVAKKAAPASTSAAKTKKAAKPAAPPSGVPLIDTSLAAQAAANMVVNRDLLAPKPAGEKKESGSFKQLKESLLKPSVQGPGGLLSPQGPQKKFNQGFGGRNQVGHNQTFGADVNRSGVPRRTSGG
jgi:hypothetical protein